MWKWNIVTWDRIWRNDIKNALICIKNYISSKIMLYIFVLYTTLSSKWYYVYMYWIVLRVVDFAPIPRSEFGSRYSWQSFPMQSFCVVSMTLPFTLHLPSPIPLGDLWCARQRINIPPSILYFSVSLSGVPRGTCRFFIHAIPVTCCKVYSFCAVNILKVEELS